MVKITIDGKIDRSARREPPFCARLAQAGIRNPHPVRPSRAHPLRRLPPVPGRSRRGAHPPAFLHPAGQQQYGRAYRYRESARGPQIRPDPDLQRTQPFLPVLPGIGGDCELQNAAYGEGMTNWPLSPNWQPFAMDASHPYFILENNRCILCRRCVRACGELVGNLPSASKNAAPSPSWSPTSAPRWAKAPAFPAAPASRFAPPAP